MATFQTLQDPFNQTSLNGALWGSSVAGSAVLSYSSAGAICTFPASSTSATNGAVYSLGYATYDLTGSYVYIKVEAVPSNSTLADATIKVASGANADFRAR